MFKKLVLALAMILSFSVVSAHAEDTRATREEAQAMCEKAVQWFKEKGKDVTFAEINNQDSTEFHDRELYLFVYDATGTNVAHGQKAALIGKNLIGLKDSDGKLMIKEIVEVANTGWVDFKWQNPVSKKVEAKSAYIIHEGDYWFGVGIYKPE